MVIKLVCIHPSGEGHTGPKKATIGETPGRSLEVAMRIIQINSVLNFSHFQPVKRYILQESGVYGPFFSLYSNEWCTV